VRGCDSKNLCGKRATPPQRKWIDTEFLTEVPEELALGNRLILGLSADFRECGLRRILLRVLEPSRQPCLHFWRRLRVDCILNEFLSKLLKFDSVLAEPNDALICSGHVTQYSTDRNESRTRDLIVCSKNRQHTKHEQCNRNYDKEDSHGHTKPGLRRLGEFTHLLRLPVGALSARTDNTAARKSVHIAGRSQCGSHLW